MAEGGGIARYLAQLKNEDWLTPLIERYYSRSRPERWVHADPTIHPSSLGTPCGLDLELGLLGHRTKADGQGARRMDNGTDVGKRWAKALADMGILKKAEEPARCDDPLISGSLDVMVQNPKTGAHSIGEIKSINSYGYKALPNPTADRVANMLAIAKHHKNYALQLTTYMTIHGLDAWFLFENKDDQEYRVWWVKPTPEMKQEVFGPGPVRSAQEAFYAGDLIAPPFPQKSLTCQRCYRKALCFALQAGSDDLWRTVQQQFKHAGVVMKEEQPGWPARGPQKLPDEEVL